MVGEEEENDNGGGWTSCTTTVGWGQSTRLVKLLRDGGKEEDEE